jgi:hypothetical protein
VRIVLDVDVAGEAAHPGPSHEKSFTDKGLRGRL